jgi:colanic acid/amylovoran biosynthesis glycosyltransferase
VNKQIAVYHYSYLPLSETFIYRQFQGLMQHFNVKVITHNIENKSEFPGIEPLIIPPQNFWRRLIRSDRKFLDKNLRGSSLFHVNFGHFAVDMQYIARRLSIPMTAYFLGVDASACLKDTEYRRKLKKASFAAVFANSQDMKKRLVPFLPTGTKCRVTYCGIPLERFPFKLRQSVPEDPIFLQVSRLDYKKGVHITLRSFSRYLQIYPTARLIIAGDGPLKSDLQRLASSLEIEKSVNFLGYIGYKEYFELLRAADVFIQPSITAPDGDMEGLPTAICEAMASGLPVISTWHSGIPEVIEDGENGFLAKENDIDSLFDRMLLLHKTDISIISQNARKKIETTFDHRKTIEILATYMNDIIAGGGHES